MSPRSHLARFKPLAGLFDFVREQLGLGQRQLVFPREHFVGQSLQRIFRERIVGFGTENETDRRIFPFVGPMLFRVVQVHVHLPGVRVREFADLEVDYDEAP